MPDLPDPKHRRDLPIPQRRVDRTFPYAELDVTTNFSFLRGASHPDELIYRAAELGHAAVAVTDINSLAGIVRAHMEAKKANIHLCIGSRLQFLDAPDVLVWAENKTGYTNLCRLLTAGKRRSEKGRCQLYLRELLEFSEGLLAAISPRSIDPIGAAPLAAQTPHRPPDHAISNLFDDELIVPHSLHATAKLLKSTMTSRLSLAISRFHDIDDRALFEEIQTVSRLLHIPLVAVNQVHYHHPHRRMLQDVLTCIRHGCTIQQAGFGLFPNGERYLKSPSEMHELFEDFPEALERSVEIAERCTFTLDELKYEYPSEIVPQGKSADDYLRQLACEGAMGRYPLGVPDKIQDRINNELRIISQLNISSYFLTVYDLVYFARSRGILCQGRGSAANSVVCYCIGVTSVDPARIDVLFERFISAARNEPPDIDIDFEHERREEVIQYVYQKYGRERAAMTAEVITYRGRSAIRDVGKAMGLSLDMVDQMAKRLDWWDRGVLTDQRLIEVGLDPEDKSIRKIIALATELLGFPRHLSQHVGGLVISQHPICESIPIENGSMPDRTVIEWDKDDLDAVGMFKVDVLALGMLTCLSKGLNELNRKEMTYQLHTIPAEDPLVYAMIQDADTVGVFQIESRAQMSMLPRLKPKEFYDLVIEVAIVRPGPIQGNMVHPYLRRRNKLEEVTFPKDELREALGRTLGVPLFQEQAMKIAMVAAGFSGEEADRLRRSMAAWRYNGSVNRFHEQIVEGMVKNGYEREFAENTFNQIKGFGEYGFPESHAASFALLVYASCWIKRYHPAIFCMSLLNSQPMGFYAPAQIVRDAEDHGVDVRPIDVNDSYWDCTIESASDDSSKHSDPLDKRTWGYDGPATRLGFRLIKGMSEIHAQQISDERRAGGAFQSIDEFHDRINLPVSVINRLSEADAFGSLDRTRRTAMWDTLALPDQRAPLPATHEVAEAQARLPSMSTSEEIRADYTTTGLSLKGHPVGQVREQLDRLKITRASDLWNRRDGSWVKVAGLVLIRQRPGTASGIVFETVEDETGIVNLIIRPPVYDRYRDAGRYAALLQADGYVQREGKVQHVIVVRMTDLSEMIQGYSLYSRDFH